jgi:hypothetical protein
VTLFINNPAVEQVLTVAECMDALEQAHAEMGRGRATNGEIFRIMTSIRHRQPTYKLLITWLFAPFGRPTPRRRA